MLFRLVLLRAGITTHFCSNRKAKTRPPFHSLPPPSRIRSSRVSRIVLSERKLATTSYTRVWWSRIRRYYVVGGEKRIKTMNEITPTRPSKVKKSKIRPKLKPIVSPTDDNYDDEGFGLGYGEWTPSKRRQQSPENDTPKDDEKKDERCDTLKLQSESNEEIRTDNAISNASDDISLTKTQLSFDNKLKLSERDVTDNEKENRANECVSQVTYSQKNLNEGNKSKCMDGVWIESTSSLLRSRVRQGFIILLCIAAICEVLRISIVIKYVTHLR